jgi:DNA-binding protein H-NS
MEYVLAKTSAQVKKQIAKLQEEANALQAKELPGVIQRIKDAIKHYGLTIGHLFGEEAGKGAPAKKTRAAAKQATGKGAAAKKAPLPAKYRDASGNSWSGHGKRPNWFKDAIASGKTLEDLMVKN